MHHSYSIWIDLQLVANEGEPELVCNGAVNEKRAETLTKQWTIVNFNANSSKT